MNKIKASNEGEITIYFSESLIIPPHIDYLNNTVLNVSLIPYDRFYMNYLNFTWNVTLFTNTYFVVRLTFENPLYVSSTGKSNFDLIRVTSLDPLYFTSKKSL